MFFYVISCHISYIVTYISCIYFAMSGRSHSYVAVHVGHQQMALEANTQKYKDLLVSLTKKGSIFLHKLVFRNKNCV